MKRTINAAREMLAPAKPSVPLHQPERAEGESFDSYRARRRVSNQFRAVYPLGMHTYGVGQGRMAKVERARRKKASRAAYRAAKTITLPDGSKFILTRRAARAMQVGVTN